MRQSAYGIFGPHVRQLNWSGWGMGTKEKESREEYVSKRKEGRKERKQKRNKGRTTTEDSTGARFNLLWSFVLCFVSAS